MTHAEANELLAALALDAVEDDERQAVEDHVAGCPRCQSELDALREVAGALGNSVEPLPEHLWSSISSRIYDDRDHELPELTLLGAEGMSSTESERPPRPARRVRIALLPLAVAAVIVGVLAFQLVHANSRASNLQRALRASDASEVTAALSAPGHRLVDLNGASNQRLAEFVMLPDGRGYLVSSTMPALASGNTYQLWGIIGGRSISIGLMGRSPGHVTFTVAGPPSPSELAVTVEPSGGTSSPTSQIVAAGTV